MKKILLVTVLGMLFVCGCGSSPTEAERPALRNGATPQLAIEMPPLFPPEPRVARIITEAWILEAGQLWFRNEESDTITLSLFVSDSRTDLYQRVGHFGLGGFATRPMELDETYTTAEYTSLTWSMLFQQGNKIHTIAVGVAQ